MTEDGALFDSAFDGSRGFPVSPETGGVSLESALREFGPAAIDDLIPRLRAVAATLDAAHGSGTVHGALHPSKVFVTDEATSLIAGDQAVAPYAAPEVTAGGAGGPRADQFALAAIAYEWLFGRPIHGPAERPIDVRAMPHVDRGALSKAFTRALARDPWDRFGSCGEFVDAIAASLVPELPLLALAPEDEQAVESFAPEEGGTAAAAPSVAPHAAPDLDTIDRGVAASFVPETEPEPTIEPIVPAAIPVEPPVTSAFRSTPVQSTAPSFGATALILATLVGAVFGFAAGYMARPRALQSGPVEQFAPQPPVAPSSASGASSASGDKGTVPGATAPAPNPAPAAQQARKAPAAPAKRAATPSSPKRATESRPRPSTPATLGKPAVTTGSVVVESRPTGASVTIDGRDRGRTPVTVSDLSPGEYRIVISMPGYRNFATTVRVVAGERTRAAASLTAVEQE